MSNSAWIQVKTSDWAEWKDESKGNANADWKAWAAEIKSWKGVDGVWSTTGSWDWIVKLDDNSSDWNGAKEVMWKIKEHKWVSETNTWWGEQL